MRGETAQRTTERPGLQRRDPRRADAAGITLIGHGRIRETIRNNPNAIIKRRLNDIGDVLPPGGKMQEAFGIGMPDADVGRKVQQRAAHPLGGGRTARLPGFDDIMAAVAQPSRQAT